MDRMIRRFSAALLAAAVAGGPAFAQVTPGRLMVGPAGGVASTAAPSNSEGPPAGGTGVVEATRASAPRHHVRRVRHHARHTARHRTADINSAAGPNGSEAPSR